MVKYRSSNHIKSDGLLSQRRHPFSTRIRGADTMNDHTPVPFFPPNLEDYAPWVATYGLVAPYGQCQCGCGQDVPMSTLTRTEKGRVKGMPIRFCHSHWHHSFSLEEAFWQYVTPGNPDDCWEWQQNRHSFGHGFLNYRRKQYQAHRVAYELHFGPIPEGLDCLHKCDNPPCCNPAHLFLGTQGDNNVDRSKKGRSARGSKVHSAKLTETDVVAIRSMRANGATIVGLAKLYGLSETHTAGIIARRKWKHIP